MDTRFQGRSEIGKNEWLTPPEILSKLGKFDLDPCAPVNRPWPTAVKHYTEADDGLRQPWVGRVYCNPPYDVKLIGRFIRRCVEHGNCIALTFARTDTKLFQDLVFPNAYGLLFIRGRLAFFHSTGQPAGNAGAPSVLIAFDKANADILRTSGIAGTYLSVTPETESLL